MKCNLFDEIHSFHTSTIYLLEYPTIVRQLRAKINNVSNLEMEHLNQMLENNQISHCEYEKMKEIIDYKNLKYQEMVNLI